MKKTIYLALAVLLTLPSCVQDGPAASAPTGDGNKIYFRSYLPTLTRTRADVISQDNLEECRVTAINTDDNSLVDPDTGEMTPYFSDVRFVKETGGLFMAHGGDSCIWPDAESTLHFFAYYPSVDTMRNAIGTDDFNLVNKYNNIGSTRSIDYRIESFRVAPDIADQVDFIAAYSSGTKGESGNSGIALNFSHQLARIEISAWGASDKYDFEIAGVRIGNPLVQGDFSFSPLMNSGNKTGEWFNRGSRASAVEHIFSEGESIVLLSKDSDSHASIDNAASIMGKAGPAMVIPMAEKINAWEGKGDAGIAMRPYSTDKLYLSVLLRVTNRKNEIVYPYPSNPDNIPTVYLAVRNDGVIIRRVYKIDEEYYTSDQKSDEHRYIPNDTEEILGFCWAALPVGAKWEAGKIYTYKLNYTDGIGWQDPSDPNPGEPIIEKGKIPFAVTVEDWVAAEGHDQNIDVPKR